MGGSRSSSAVEVEFHQANQLPIIFGLSKSLLGFSCIIKCTKGKLKLYIFTWASAKLVFRKIIYSLLTFCEELFES